MSYDSADESGLRIVKEASGRDTLPSLAWGGCGREVWTAAALLFSWNETPGDHVQRTELCMNGRSGTVRKRDPDGISRPQQEASPEETQPCLCVSFMKPINLLCCLRQFEMGPLSLMMLRVLTDRPQLTETN